MHSVSAGNLGITVKLDFRQRLRVIDRTPTPVPHVDKRTPHCQIKLPSLRIAEEVLASIQRGRGQHLSCRDLAAHAGGRHRDDLATVVAGVA